MFTIESIKTTPSTIGIVFAMILSPNGTVIEIDFESEKAAEKYVDALNRIAGFTE